MSITRNINGKQITFDVEPLGDGVCLVATHVDGKRNYSGYLLRVQPDGTYAREWGVDGQFGFKLNSEGRIKQNKDF